MMRVSLFHQFRQPLTVETVPDPSPPPHGVVLRVHACGVCRSDWHGWQGHDADIKNLPHVPGHEIAGEVAAVGSEVTGWRVGARVTVPFACGCGTCAPCLRGAPQVCDHQTQPGFTHWGAFAEYVVIHHADLNLVALPDAIDFTSAASLGCRFATSFRAIVDQGRVKAGEWVAVYGCGGVGLSAVMIAAAEGARVIAVDISAAALEAARDAGAEFVVSGSATASEQVRELTNGGVHLSTDALGSATTCEQSILSLAKSGRHVQIGLLLAEDFRPRIPMEKVIAHELELIGSHGMAATDYPRMLQRVLDGRLNPGKLVERRIGLEDAGDELAAMSPNASAGDELAAMSPHASARDSRRGMAVIERF